MRRKALITGVLPHPFEGPWVALDVDVEWRIEGLVRGIEVERVDGKARAIVGENASFDDRVSVFAVEVR